jgi:Domain of unknown function (DUF4249)
MKNSIVLFALLLAITACEKTITIDLNSTDPKVIIEGEVTDEAGSFKVKISKTVNFSDANNFPAVKGAIVTISDNTGSTQTLTKLTAGLYTLKYLKGISGKTYTLKVVAEGKTYTASSTMPKVVNLLGAKIEESSFGGGGSSKGSAKNYDIYPLFLDSVETQDNYIFFLSSKGKKKKGLEISPMTTYLMAVTTRFHSMLLT